MRRVMAQAVSQGHNRRRCFAVGSRRTSGHTCSPDAQAQDFGHRARRVGIGQNRLLEPAEVVEANNRLRELEMEERREITRILQTLADIIRPNIDDLLDGFELLGIFDFIYAKAKYAKKCRRRNARA